MSKLRVIFILLWCLYGQKEVRSQTVLDGVYIREFSIRNGDTLTTKIRGKVLDKKTLVPLPNIRIEYLASNGQNIRDFTDESGNFYLVNLYADSIKAKIVCSGSLYKTIIWEFNTYGISQPREFNFNFELEQK